MHRPNLVPELLVGDLDASLRFWVELIGFEIFYQRKSEGFVYLRLDGAEVMLEERRPQNRQWITGELSKPLGRGINLQIEVPEVDAVRERLMQSGIALFMEPEERWYEAGDRLVGQRQFLVTDGDGYLLRIIQTIGEKAVQRVGGSVR